MNYHQNKACDTQIHNKNLELSARRLVFFQGYPVTYIYFFQIMSFPTLMNTI